MKLAHSVALAAFLLAGSHLAAAAKVFELPDEKPVITVTLPDAWKPTEIEDGAQATSPDTSIYIAVEMTEATNIEAAAKGAMEFLIKSGVKIDPKTQKDTSGKFGTLDYSGLTFSGTDKDGPTNVGVTFVLASPSKIAVVTYWGSPAGEKKYAAQLQSVAESIQPLK